ncbi:uncharacterized protein DS421_11g320070 [Arachis hypogaea]|nr:uncharacterized protein DS421_11g320070 [Arachis hypogaea]
MPSAGAWRRRGRFLMEWLRGILFVGVPWLFRLSPALEIAPALGIELKFNSNCNGGFDNTSDSRKGSGSCRRWRIRRARWFKKFAHETLTPKRTSIDSVRSVHRGIGCRQSPARISMSESDEAENEDAVDETPGGEDMVDETLADEDEVDQPGTGDDVVGDDSGSDVQGKSKGYNLRVDPARKSRSRWSPLLIKKRGQRM